METQKKKYKLKAVNITVITKLNTYFYHSTHFGQGPKAIHSKKKYVWFSMCHKYTRIICEGAEAATS